MGLRDKYSYAIQTAKDLKMQGSADERDGKLFFHGTVGTQAEANKIWDAIKTIPDWPTDIVADIKATGSPSGPAARAAETTYVVKAGDTLGIIEAMKMFNPIEAEVSGTVLKILMVRYAPGDRADDVERIERRHAGPRFGNLDPRIRQPEPLRGCANGQPQQ